MAAPARTALAAAPHCQTARAPPVPPAGRLPLRLPPAVRRPPVRRAAAPVARRNPRWRRRGEGSFPASWKERGASAWPRLAGRRRSGTAAAARSVRKNPGPGAAPEVNPDRNARRRPPGLCPPGFAPAGLCPGLSCMLRRWQADFFTAVCTWGLACGWPGGGGACEAGVALTASAVEDDDPPGAASVRLHGGQPSVGPRSRPRSSSGCLSRLCWLRQPALLYALVQPEAGQRKRRSSCGRRCLRMAAAHCPLASAGGKSSDGSW